MSDDYNQKADPLPPAAAWKMFCHMPEVCRAPEVAGAFIYAAQQPGWLDFELDQDGFDGADPLAMEKLRVRRAVLNLLHATTAHELDRETFLQLMEAIPTRWLATYNLGQRLMRSCGQYGTRAADDALSASDRERYYRIQERISKAR